MFCAFENDDMKINFVKLLLELEAHKGKMMILILF